MHTPIIIKQMVTKFKAKLIKKIKNSMSFPDKEVVIEHEKYRCNQFISIDPMELKQHYFLAKV